MEKNHNPCVKDNVWIKKIDQSLTKNPVDDEIILSAAFQHLKVFADFFTKDEKEFMAQEEIVNVLLSKLFLDKMPFLIPKERFTCQVDANSGWPIPLLPLELFDKAKFSEAFRRNLFFECLKEGDILECRVMSVLPTHYNLKVIHKYGAIRILEDLNISVMLQVQPEEMALLPDKLHKDHLLRVAVKNIVTEPQIAVVVTLNDSILALKENKVKLGIISEENLPSYVCDPPDVSQFKSFSDYLNSLPGFQNHLLYQDMTTKFGIDRNRIYSFFPRYECFLCPDAFTGKALLNEAKKKDVADLLEAARAAFKEKNVPKALRKIKLALDLDPQCQDGYQLRGKIYATSEWPKLSKNAVVYYEKVYSMDPNNNYIKQYIAEGFSRAASVCYKRKRYQDALKFAEKALNFNPNNSVAAAMIDYLKLKHSDSSLDLDAVSLHQLQAEKQKLVSKLKEIETAANGDKKLIKVKVEKK